MFNQILFEQHLATSWVGRSFLYFNEIGSTNTYAKTADAKQILPGTVIVADHQTAGRGQHHRPWKTEAGLNLTFSVIFRPTKAERLTILTLACASAVMDVLGAHAQKNEFILKWPNDVLYGDKKISGLLTEAVYSGNLLDRVVVGIGININQTQFDPDLGDVAISLANICSEDQCREKILSALLSRLEYNYQRWATRDIGLIREINPRILGYGNWVKINLDGRDLPDTYKFLGMNEAGQLQVLNKELEVNTFSYEQVRVKFD